MPVIKCPQCGSMISTKAVACPKCGYAVNGSMPNNGGTNQPYYPPQQTGSQGYPPQQPYQPNNPLQQNGKYDEVNVGLCILSFIFPLVGWILYFVYKNNYPIKAKACSKWAWISIAVSFAIGFIGGFLGSL